MKRRLVVSVLLAVMLAVGLGGVALAASQTWDLDSDLVMYKETHGETGTVDIAKGATTRWTAENAAQCDVPFPADTWTGTLKCGAINNNKQFTVSVGKWDGTTFTGYGTSATYIFDTITKSYSVAVLAFTVPIGDWLAIEVASVGNLTITLQTDGTCDVISPGADPGYPIPELPTIVLLTTGLVAVAAYFGFKRYRKAYARA
ncbi:MAG: hypothetical protein E3J67_03605 [Dehalococcoidia bacterium]|nr:MAG: hypothetical protein E3J67_03605 [Dehalococcoidia bacterium]